MYKPGHIHSTIIFTLVLTGAFALAVVTLFAHPGHKNPPGVPLRSTAQGAPYVDRVLEDVGNLRITVRNDGTIGPDPYFGGGVNNPESYMEYPLGTDNAYPTPRLVVGGILDRDTLVTWVQEWWPGTLEEQILNGEALTICSINDTGRLAEQAKSEKDISCIFYDTLVDLRFTGNDSTDNRQHIPLNLKVKQTVYAWGYEFAEDFVIFDYVITNIGNSTIEDVYLGIEMRGGFDYAIVTGFLKKYKTYTLSPTSCDFSSDISLFWTADNDGDPDAEGNLDPAGPNAAVGIKLLRVPETVTDTNFNWWEKSSPSQDWGPRRQGTVERPFRSFGSRMGSPAGDRNRYYMMSSPEFDYDQIYAALDHSEEGWMPPSVQKIVVATGEQHGSHNHHWNMISVGPATIPPGGSIPLAFAYTLGDGFHKGQMIPFDPMNPDEYHNTYHFDDLVKNATWASWVYDNPGIDTDDDGYRGLFHVCYGDTSLAVDTTLIIDTMVFPPDTQMMFDSAYVASVPDTQYYTGDGVPDIRAASPPPAPDVRFTPSNGEIRIEWNGLRSETTKDVFTGQFDFEGYRVYLGLERNHDQMVLQTSYDIEDFTQYFFDRTSPANKWIVLREPFSLREIQDQYTNGNRDYDPLVNSIDNPLIIGDSMFYFVSQDHNQSDLTNSLGIQKAYPDEPYPHTLSLDSALTSDTFLVDETTGDTTYYPGGELTPDGKHFKYFEYYYTARNLLPSRKYYVSVTAFDYGSQQSNLPFLETNPVTNAVEVFALDRIPQEPPDGLHVIVYPNPYRIDGRYRELGYEGRGQESMPEERMRAVNFVNLPPECVIRIYSLDGDLVDRIEHNQDPGSPTAMYEKWDLITRNTQLAVSGIYYWVVETPAGETQIGKLVLIL